MELTETSNGKSENPMLNHPGNGPDMVKVMLPSITFQSTVQSVPSNV